MITINPLSSFISQLGRDRRRPIPLRYRVHLRNHPRAHMARTRMLEREAIKRWSRPTGVEVAALDARISGG